MEETCLRRPHSPLLQDQQAGSNRSPVETKLRFHLHHGPGGVDYENFSARAARDARLPGFLQRAAGRPYSFVAGRADHGRHLYHFDRPCRLRQQEIFRRNFRVRDAPLVVENLKCDQFAKLCEIVAKLRAPGGCPWDREQTHESLLPATIEEAYEVAEAARAKNDAHFREELGDLLLLVVMHAEIAREAGKFNIDNVVAEITEKLIRRHPHVFGESGARDAGAVLKQWEAIKREEKKTDTHYLASLPNALPALMRAQKAQGKVARVNFDWTELRDVITKVEEELSELKHAITNEDQRSIEDEV